MTTKSKTYRYKALTKRAFSYLTRAREKGYSLSRINSDTRKMLSEYKGLNTRDRAALYNAIYEVARKIKHREDWEEVLSRNTTYDEIIRATRKVKKNISLRAKKKNWKQTDGTIFYMCSSHTPVAEDHKDYQGKIYVDRYWRQIVSSELYIPVLRMIKEQGIKTVQEIMGPPVYLTTRPYCRHYFIPLRDTLAVLNGDDSQTEAVKKKRNKMYDYYQDRQEIYERLNKIHPCKAFKKKADK